VTDFDDWWQVSRASSAAAAASFLPSSAPTVRFYLLSVSVCLCWSCIENHSQQIVATMVGYNSMERGFCDESLTVEMRWSGNNKLQPKIFFIEKGSASFKPKKSALKRSSRNSWKRDLPLWFASFSSKVALKWL
jgi:hypothetical protein